jgi:hypothetical protein
MLIGMDLFVGLIQDLRASRDTPAATLPPPDRKDLQRRINCPHCGKVMDTHLYGGPGKVIIDDCERCATTKSNSRPHTGTRAIGLTVLPGSRATRLQRLQRACRAGFVVGEHTG